MRARERLLPLQVFVGAELSAVQAFFYRYFFAVAGESRDQGVGDHVLEAGVASTFEFGYADGAGFCRLRVCGTVGAALVAAVGREGGLGGVQGRGHGHDKAVFAGFVAFSQINERFGQRLFAFRVVFCREGSFRQPVVVVNWGAGFERFATVVGAVSAGDMLDCPEARGDAGEPFAAIGPEQGRQGAVDFPENRNKHISPPNEN